MFHDEAALYASYDSAWNTVRVAKSLVWGLLLGALMWAHSPALKPAAWVARGMVAGLALVCLVVLWERGVYAGLFDFSLPYRTTRLVLGNARGRRCHRRLPRHGRPVRLLGRVDGAHSVALGSGQCLGGGRRSTPCSPPIREASTLRC